MQPVPNPLRDLLFSTPILVTRPDAVSWVAVLPWPVGYPDTALKAESPAHAVRIDAAFVSPAEAVARFACDLSQDDLEGIGLWPFSAGDPDQRPLLLYVSNFQSAQGASPSSAAPPEVGAFKGLGKKVFCKLFHDMMAAGHAADTPIALEASSLRAPTEFSGFEHLTLQEVVLRTFAEAPAVLSDFIRNSQFVGLMVASEADKERFRVLLSKRLRRALENESLVRYYESYGFTRITKSPSLSVFMKATISNIMDACVGAGLWS